MSHVQKNILVFIVAYLATDTLARELVSIWLIWQTSESLFHMHSFYTTYGYGFIFESLAYISGGIIVQGFFSGSRILVWSWGLCLVALLFQPFAWGRASISVVTLFTETLFLASVYLPPLMLGISATIWQVWRSRGGKQLAV